VTRSQRTVSGWLGRTRTIVESAPSTQDVLLERVRARAAGDGELVLARRQTHGRGRRGRAWFAPTEGALALSFALVPAGSAGSLGLVALATALGAAEAVETEAGLACAIKWPNDIVLRGRKLGGVLVDASVAAGGADEAGGETAWAVVGLGLNVNVAEADFPPELAAGATSVSIELGRAADIEAILERFLERAGTHLDRVRAGASGEMRGAVEARLLARGRRVRVAGADGDGAAPVEGRLEGLDDAGRLRLVLDSGEERVISSGDLAVGEVPDA